MSPFSARIAGTTTVNEDGDKNAVDGQDVDVVDEVSTAESLDGTTPGTTQTPQDETAVEPADAAKAEREAAKAERQAARRIHRHRTGGDPGDGLPGPHCRVDNKGNKYYMIPADCEQAPPAVQGGGGAGHCCCGRPRLREPGGVRGSSCGGCAAAQRGRQAELAEERGPLRPLPARPLEACERLRVRVGGQHHPV